MPSKHYSAVKTFHLLWGIAQITHFSMLIFKILKCFTWSNIYLENMLRKENQKRKPLLELTPIFLKQFKSQL